MTADLDWLVVGGGIHGVHLAVRLLAEAGVPPERLRILDPGPRLLDNWRRCSANTGMTHLRSPAVHHLDLEPWSLLRFAGADTRGRGAPKELFANPYNRPAVALFERHCDEVIGRFGLAGLHLRDRAARIDLACDHATVHTASGASLRARRVLLALGAGQRPRWPAWARELRSLGHRVHHVFEPGFDLRPESWPERVAVIGGGISAAQVALRLAEAGRSVSLIARHAPRRHQFDSDPGWVGPKYMRRFSATKDLVQRRAMITRARHAGSMPPDVHRALRRAIDQGGLTWLMGEPVAEAHDGGAVLQVDGERVPVDGVLLATGFEGTRPGGALVDELVESHALPCAGCGYPVVDRHLRWHPAVYVTGPLAELEVGPVSRNIIGARRAAERILPAARAS